jgi:hypothetical protein
MVGPSDSARKTVVLLQQFAFNRRRSTCIRPDKERAINRRRQFTETTAFNRLQVLTTVIRGGLEDVFN